MDLHDHVFRFIPPSNKESNGLGDVLKFSALAYSISVACGFGRFTIIRTGFSRSLADFSAVGAFLGLTPWLDADLPDRDSVTIDFRDGLPAEGEALTQQRFIAQLQARIHAVLGSGRKLYVTSTYDTVLRLFAANLFANRWNERLRLPQQRIDESALAWGQGTAGRVRVLIHLRLGDVACLDIPPDRVLSLKESTPRTVPAYVAHAGASQYPQLSVGALARCMAALRDLTGPTAPEILVCTDGYDRTFKGLVDLLKRMATSPSSPAIRTDALPALKQYHEAALRRTVAEAGAGIIYGESDEKFLRTIKAALTCDVLITPSGGFLTSIVANFVPPERQPVTIRSLRKPLTQDLSCLYATAEDLRDGLVGLMPEINARLVQRTRTDK